MAFFRLVDTTGHLKRLAWAWFNRRPGTSRRELLRYQARRVRARRVNSPPLEPEPGPVPTAPSFIVGAQGRFIGIFRG